MNNLDYGKVFKVLVKETANYVKVNNLKAMVLGISGGIDSTVVAAMRLVSKLPFLLLEEVFLLRIKVMSSLLLYM